MASTIFTSGKLSVISFSALNLRNSQMVKEKKTKALPGRLPGTKTFPNIDSVVLTFLLSH